MMISIYFYRAEFECISDTLSRDESGNASKQNILKKCNCFSRFPGVGRSLPLFVLLAFFRLITKIEILASSPVFIG